MFTPSPFQGEGWGEGQELHHIWPHRFTGRFTLTRLGGLADLSLGGRGGDDHLPAGFSLLLLM